MTSRAEWRETAIEELIKLFDHFEWVDSTMLKKRMKEIGFNPPEEFKDWGFPFRAAKKAGKIKKLGYHMSTEKQCNGRPITKWEKA